MHWQKRNAWKIGIAITGMLLLLLIMEWISVSVVGANAGALEQTQLGMVTVQATPTEDATVTALNKELLAQQVAQQQHTWDNWLWGNAATILSSFLSTLVIVIGALFGLWRWRRERQDVRDKESKERQIELEKRAEERFQAAVTGLGDEKEGARIGAALLLRTFLHPGYEQFYTQTFDLAVANLRLPRTPNPAADQRPSLLLSSLSRALIVVFTEAYPLVRDREKRDRQSLDASAILLDNAYLSRVDLKRIWMPRASLQDADLSYADLSHADLSRADLRGAKLSYANLSHTNLGGADLSEGSYTDYNEETILTRTNLSHANLSGADLSYANLSGVDLSNADLSEANLSNVNFGEDNPYNQGFFLRANLSHANLSGANLHKANLEGALSLKDANLRKVKGLTKEQLESCKAKGAIIDDDPTTNLSQSTVVSSSSEPHNDVQASSISPAQGSLPTPDADESSAPSSTNS